MVQFAVVWLLLERCTVDGGQMPRPCIDQSHDPPCNRADVAYLCGYVCRRFAVYAGKFRRSGIQAQNWLLLHGRLSLRKIGEYGAIVRGLFTQARPDFLGQA